MIGTLLNVAGILVGGTMPLVSSGQLPGRTQVTLKGILGFALTVLGMWITWAALSGGFWAALKQLGLVMLAMVLGRLVGRLLRLQKGANRLGQFAKQKLENSTANTLRPWADGFVTATVLLCANPLAILGALQDGLQHRWQTLGIKAVIDALAAVGCVPILGKGVLVAAIPLLAWQGTLTLAAQWLSPWLQQHGLLSAVNATCGLLIFSLALGVLDLRRVEVSDYLPSLVVAPLLAWWWR